MDLAAWEIFLEGKYNYFDQGKVYSEEVFKVFKQDKAFSDYILTSQTMSRTKLGEFLKVDIEYKFNQNFETSHIKIERQMGAKQSREQIIVNEKEKNFIYSFTADGKTQKTQHNYNNYVHLATPCFAASMLMTQMKKIDPVHRTQYSIYSSPNIWNFTEDISAQDVYVELQEIEPVELDIGEAVVRASYCKLLQVDENGTIASEGQDIYLSKYLGIPYKGVFSNGLEIEVESLKKPKTATI